MELAKSILHLGYLLLTATFTSAGENFLYSGCRITSDLKNVFHNSLQFHLKYYSSDFKLTVTQSDVKHSLKFNRSDTSIQMFRWMPLELVMEEKLGLRFNNGTTLITEENNPPMNMDPEKKLSVVEGSFLPDCPQEMPNWRVSRNLPLEHVFINDGDEEVFSFTTTTPTKMPLKVGDKELTLCWNSDRATMLVDEPSRCAVHENLPPFTVHWLQLRYESQMVYISHPENPAAHLASFSLQKNMERVTFHNNEGVAYVVHHLRGYPRSKKQNQQPVSRSSQMKAEDICMWVSTVAGTIIILVLIIFILMTALFYNRWMDTRGVLIMLKNSDASRSGRMFDDSGKTRKESLPSHPAPALNALQDSAYLSPREFKDLRGGNDNRKSEHIYEDMNVLFGKPDKVRGQIVTKDNIAFVNQGIKEDMHLM